MISWRGEKAPRRDAWAEMRSGYNGGRNKADVDLVAAALTGNTDSVSRFIAEISGVAWASCLALSSYEGEARDSFIEIMAQLRSSGFASFRDYDGRSTLKTFTALVVRELHCGKLHQLLDSNPAKAWRLFEQLFEADIKRQVQQRISSPASEEFSRDLYQAVCLAFIDENYRRIHSYTGKGSFAGYILRCAENIIRDQIRRNILRRRRLPAEIERLGEIEREIFKLIAWYGCPERLDVVQLKLQSRFARDVGLTAIERALDRVRQHIGRAPAPPNPDDLMPAGHSPEEIAIRAASDDQLSAAVGALAQAAGKLSDDERTYLDFVLSENPPPARELAQLLSRPVEEIYALKKRVLRKLREQLSENSAVKQWLASV